jgi:microcystin-dependent protein
MPLEASMPDPFLAEIRCFGFDFAPPGWAPCAGQSLPINQNQALFSLLGTTYGGDGRTTFNLPDLRGRVPMSFGQGPGLSTYAQGQSGGDESVTLQAGQIPGHTHQIAASSTATTTNPAAAVPAVTPARAAYGTTTDLAMSPAMVGLSSGDGAHPNVQPYLVLNWCIAVAGVYPSRP